MNTKPWYDLNRIPKPILFLVVRPLWVFAHVFVGAEIVVPLLSVLFGGQDWKKAATEKIGPLLAIAVGAAVSSFGKGVIELGGPSLKGLVDYLKQTTAAADNDAHADASGQNGNPTDTSIIQP